MEETAAERALDALLKKSNLLRKKVPKDGACMFRCVAEEVYGTQILHRVLRSQCVRYMRTNSDTFSPFVIGCSDLPWDHYLFELEKVETWGGYLELLALSKMLKVNFTIITDNSPPTEVDHGFPVTLRLAYSGGNHYDLIATNKAAEVHAFCQGLIYSIAQKIAPEQNGAAETPNGNISKNIAYECWVAEQKKLEIRDKLITKKLLETPQKDYSVLSGYYKKDTTPQQTTPQNNKDTKHKKKKKPSKQQQFEAKHANTTVKVPTPNNNNNNNNNRPSAWSPSVTPSPVPVQILSTEDLEMQRILAEIEAVEKKELYNISFNEHFPTLKTKPKTDTPPSPSITATPPADTTPVNNPANTTTTTTTPASPTTPTPTPTPTPTTETTNASTTANNNNNSTPTDAPTSPPTTTTDAPAAPKPSAWKTPKNWNTQEIKPTQS